MARHQQCFYMMRLRETQDSEGRPNIAAISCMILCFYFVRRFLCQGLKPRLTNTRYFLQY